MYTEIGRGLLTSQASRRAEAHEELVAFFERFPWQLFCTFTFGRRLRNGDAEGRWAWKQFMNELERDHGDTIGRLVAEEKRYGSGGLSEIRLHYHALFASDHIIAGSTIRRAWSIYAGNGRNLVDVRTYDRSSSAVAYCLKLHGSMEGELELYNLDLYSPIQSLGCEANSRSRRRLRRQLARRSNSAGDQSTQFPLGGGGDNSAPA